MQPPQLTMCRRMIAVGIILLGPTSTAAFEMRRCVLFA